MAALFLHNTWPRVVRAPDYPFGEPLEEWHRRVRETRLRWGSRDYQREEMRKYFPSYADDPVFEQWHVNHERLAASPGAAAWFMRVLMETDIREVLPAISVPTLMMYNARYRDGCVQMAERIPNAEMVELSAPDISTYADPRVGEEVQRFLAEGRVDSAPERVLTTVLFTDIVDSTSRASELGDRRWRELLGAHHATVAGPDRPLRRQGGPRHGGRLLRHLRGPRPRDRRRARRRGRGGGSRARRARGRPHRRGGDRRRQDGGHRRAHRRAHRGRRSTL